MKIFAPITDYIQKSIMTTIGDIVQRGASVPARLAIGTGYEILMVNPAGNALEYQPMGAHFRWGEESAKNAGLVTITTSWTDIVLLDLGNVYIYERYLINVLVKSTKTTAGFVTIAVEKSSGTGDIGFMVDLTSVFTSGRADNADDLGLTMSALLHITGTGTLVIKLKGQCNAGTSAVSASEGQITSNQLTW